MDDTEDMFNTIEKDESENENIDNALKMKFKKNGKK